MGQFEKGTVPAGAVPFQPGQSGNPAGRPAGSRNRAALLRRWLDTPIPVTFPGSDTPEPGTLEDAVALALIRRALTGDTRACREVMDSVYGKVPAAAPQPTADAPPTYVTLRLTEVRHPDAPPTKTTCWTDAHEKGPPPCESGPGAEGIKLATIPRPATQRRYAPPPGYVREALLAPLTTPPRWGRSGQTSP